MAARNTEPVSALRIGAGSGHERIGLASSLPLDDADPVRIAQIGPAYLAHREHGEVRWLCRQHLPGEVRRGEPCIQRLKGFSLRPSASIGQTAANAS